MVAINKRAISPEQKALRREQILAAAAGMFLSQAYEAVNMTALAETVGITKPALYRYFRGKEVLFLALFEEELVRLKQGFTSLGQPKDLGSAVAHKFASQPLYCRLSAILHIVLERGLTYEEALAFKLSLKAHIAEIGQSLTAALQTADQALVYEKLMQAQQALIGAWHMTHPIGAVEKVLQREDLALFSQDFEPVLASHLNAIFRT